MSDNVCETRTTKQRYILVDGMMSDEEFVNFVNFCINTYVNRYLFWVRQIMRSQAVSPVSSDGVFSQCIAKQRATTDDSSRPDWWDAKRVKCGNDVSGVADQFRSC